MLSRVPFTWPRAVVCCFFSSRFRSALLARTRSAAYVATSSSERNSLSASSSGRSNGVTVRKSQTPLRSGCPSGVRRSPEPRPDWASAAVVTSNASAALLTANARRRMLMVSSSIRQVLPVGR